MVTRLSRDEFLRNLNDSGLFSKEEIHAMLAALPASTAGEGAAVAERLIRFIYSSGNSIEPTAAYRAFRGRAPTPEPMLKQRGLLEEEVA